MYWMPVQKMTDYALKLPIFWGHGSADPIVPFQLAQASKELLTNAGIKPARESSEGPPTGLEFHKYDGIPHSACQEEIEDLANWLKRVIPKTD